MRVERFFLFFPPKLVSITRGETEYGIGAIPLGGFVKITGMNPEEEIPPEVVDRAYYRQPVWKRIVVIAAGPFVNIVLALILFFVLAVGFGLDTGPTNTVGTVSPDLPAANVLQPGDEIVSVDGRRVAGLPPEKLAEAVRDQVATHECAGDPTDGCIATTAATLKVIRDGRAPDGSGQAASTTCPSRCRASPTIRAANGRSASATRRSARPCRPARPPASPSTASGT